MKARLVRSAFAYPEKQLLPAIVVSKKPFHLANHAFGIGDATVGLYAATGIARSGSPVIYHTRFPQWLCRVSVPGLTITDEPPPPDTADIDANYAEQLRYDLTRAGWYGMMGTVCDSRLNSQMRYGQVAAPSPSPARPLLDKSVCESALDLGNYVMLVVGKNS